MDLRRGDLLADARVHDQRAIERRVTCDVPRATCHVLALILLALAAPVAAQSVEVSPLRVELAMARGGTHTQAVTLTNQGTEAVRVRARLQDWFITRDGTPQFEGVVPAAEKEFVATTWVRIAPPEQVVEPGQQAIVRFTVAAPADAADGGYRAAILFEFSPAAADPLAARRAVQFRSRIATLLYMDIGKVPPKIELTDLASRFRAGQPPAVVAMLRNDGRGNVRTKGTVTLRDAAGQIVRTLAVPNVPVLPMQEREVAIPADKPGDAPLAPGTYRVEVRLDLGMPELLVGETTMTVPAAKQP